MPRKNQTLIAIASFLVFLLPLGCNAPATTQPSSVSRDPNKVMLLDFESPETLVQWVEPSAPNSAPSTAPSTAPATSAPARNESVTRSADHPNTGLWCIKATLKPHQQRGDLLHQFATPVDLSTFDTLTAAIMHLAAPERRGEFLASVFIVDENGKRATGDPLPVTGRWQDLLLNLKRDAAGLDLSKIAAMGLELRRVISAPDDAPPMDLQTDTWAASRDRHTYLGHSGGKGLFVERVGTELHLSVPQQYEITFYQRSGATRPWFEVKQSNRPLLGGEDAPGTGLMLLDQDRYDALGSAIHQDAWDNATNSTAAPLPQANWPIPIIDGKPSEETRWRWLCTWTSPVGAIVEVNQETGPYDRLGEPAVQVTWRFMIYQWGQVFVHAQWKTGSRSPTATQPRPMTWALVLNETSDLENDPSLVHAKTPADADRLLNAIYPASVRDGLQTALPHQMQRQAAIAMIAKSGASSSGTREKNLWWWAKTANAKRIFGVGLTGATDNGASDCMLLINKPTALMQAGSFAQYLVPPKIKVREGELDRNFPGDADNDGFVESYGFQVIRLANGRATFMVYPQERPLFYPPYLFTIPAIEREKVNLKNSRLLVNLDGKQFADPPQFPDGSFLLQLPYVIDRPVQVEAVLVPK